MKTRMMHFLAFAISIGIWLSPTALGASEFPSGSECARPGFTLVRFILDDFVTVVAGISNTLYLAECLPHKDSRGRTWLALIAQLHFEGVRTARDPVDGIWKTSIKIGFEDLYINKEGAGVCYPAKAGCHFLIDNLETRLIFSPGIQNNRARSIDVVGEIEWLNQKKLQRIDLDATD